MAIEFLKCLPCAYDSRIKCLSLRRPVKFYALGVRDDLNALFKDDIYGIKELSLLFRDVKGDNRKISTRLRVAVLSRGINLHLSLLSYLLFSKGFLSVFSQTFIFKNLFCDK